MAESNYPGLMASVSCQGDSLSLPTTILGTTPISYPAQLQWRLPDRLVQTYAIGGQTAQRCVARQGGLVVYVTLTGNAFAGAGAVSCTLNANPTNTANAQLLSTASDTTTRYMSGVVCGIPCFLTRTQPGSETYTITPYKSSTASIPAGSVFYPDESYNNLNTIQVMWYGRNNVPNLLSGVTALYDSAVALLPKPKRFIIIGILPAQTEIIGTATYIAIASVNDQLAVTWGENFIPSTPPTVDEMAELKYSPTAQDNIDIANGIFPTGMRLDSVHLATSGYAVIALRVYKKIMEIGW